MTAIIAQELTYKRTLVPKQLLFAEGDDTSALIDCGGMQPRALLFPSTWTPCNIGLYASIVTETVPGYELFNITNVDSSTIGLATVASQWLPILPYLTDSVPYLQIQCDAPQGAATMIILLLEPIYQGVHG